MKNIVDIVATLLLADGEFGESEKQFLQGLETETEYNGFAAQVEAKIKEIENLSDDALTDVLYNAAKEIKEDDKSKAFELGIVSILADNVVTQDEVANILTLANALEIPTEKAITRLLFQVQESEQEIQIDVEDDLQEFFIVGGRTRYVDFAAFEKNVLTAKSYNTNLIAALKEIDSWIRGFGDKASVGYGPNFLTGKVSNPVGRTGNFVFVHLKKNYIMTDSDGIRHNLNQASEFTATIKNELISYFNQLSKEKI